MENYKWVLREDVLFVESRDIWREIVLKIKVKVDHLMWNAITVKNTDIFQEIVKVKERKEPTITTIIATEKVILNVTTVKDLDILPETAITIKVREETTEVIEVETVINVVKKDISPENVTVSN